MNFKLKGLVAAAVLAASIPAHAAIDLASTGNGSFLLTAVDFTNNISATFDLGQNYNDYVGNAASSNAWDLTTGDYATAWSTFMATANVNNIKWFVAAGDNLGITVGSKGFISTYAGTPTSWPTSAMITALGAFDFYAQGNDLSGTGTVVSNHATVANGASVANGGQPYAQTAFTSALKLNNTGPVVGGSIDSALQVFQVLNAANGLTAATPTVFAGSSFLLSSNGQLTYTTAIAPVPEADTYAMMLAGLGVMGFIARRRTKA